jgi:hypothetical protein
MERYAYILDRHQTPKFRHFDKYHLERWKLMDCHTFDVLSRKCLLGTVHPSSHHTACLDTYQPKAISTRTQTFNSCVIAQQEVNIAIRDHSRYENG